MKIALLSSLSIPCAGEVVSRQAGAFGRKLSAARRIQCQSGKVNPRFAALGVNS